MSIKARIAYASEFPREKTLSALNQAVLLAPAARVLVLDMERQAQTYQELFPGIVIKEMSPPFDAAKISAELIAAAGKYDCVVVDCASHVWTRCLELNDKNAENKITGLRSWKHLSPIWDSFLSGIKYAPFHVLTTWSMKDYLVPKDGQVVNQGKKVVGRHGNKGLKQNYQMVFMLGEDGKTLCMKDDFGLFPDWKEAKLVDDEIVKKIAAKFAVKKEMK